MSHQDQENTDSSQPVYRHFGLFKLFKLLLAIK